MPADAAVNADAVGAGVVEDGAVCCVPQVVAPVAMGEEEVEEVAAGVTTVVLK